MCLTKSGESGKDSKGVVAQKDERGRNLGLQAIVYFIRLKIGSQWNRCGRGVQF